MEKSILKKTILYLLIIGNVIGAFFGFTWWYGDQLARTAWYWWPVAAPSPLYAALFVVSSALLLFKVKNSVSISLFHFIASVGLIKYGIWTVIFWLTFPGSSELGILLVLWLTFSHATMAAESLLLSHAIDLRNSCRAVSFIIISLLWFGLNDFYHYFYGGMMTKISIPHMSIALITAISLTVIAPFIVFLSVKRTSKPLWGMLPAVSKR